MKNNKMDLWLALPFVLGGLFLCGFGSYHLIEHCTWHGAIIILLSLALIGFVLGLLVLCWFLIMILHDLTKGHPKNNDNSCESQLGEGK